MEKAPKNLVVAQALGVIVTVAGIFFLFAVISHKTIAASILPQWISMTFTTALCFILSGPGLFAVASIIRKDSGAALVVILGSALFILIFMTAFLASLVFHVRIGLEDLFISETATVYTGMQPGTPSLATISAFLLFVCAEIFVILKVKNLKSKLLFVGQVIMAIGVVAILGYILGLPPLYYFVKKLSVPIAFNTSALFILLGAGLALTGIGEE